MANALTGKTATYISIPAFNKTAPTWVGASTSALQYNFTASRNFFLTQQFTKPSNTNFMLCIRYRVGSITTRYKLWTDPLFKGQDSQFPLYMNQLIKKNFVIEVWSLEGEATCYNPVEIKLTTGIRTLVSDLLSSVLTALGGVEFTNFGNQTAAQGLPTTNLINRWTAESFNSGDPVTDWTSTHGALDVLTVSSGTVSCDNTASGGLTPTTSNYLNFSTSALMSCDSTDWNQTAVLNGSANFWFVMRQRSFTTAKKLVTWYDTVSGSNLIYSFRAITPTPNVRISELANAVNSTADSRLVLDTFFIVWLVPDATGDSLLQIGDILDLKSAALNLGALTNYTSFALGDSAVNAPISFAEVLVYGTIQPSYESIFMYLKQKYFGAIPWPITYHADVAWLDNV